MNNTLLQILTKLQHRVRTATAPNRTHHDRHLATARFERPKAGTDGVFPASGRRDGQYGEKE